MNYNPNAGIRNLPGGRTRRMQHVSDVNAVGPAVAAPTISPYMQSAPGAMMMDPMMSGTGPVSNFEIDSTQTSSYSTSGFNNGGMPMPSQSYGYIPPPQPQPPPTTSQAQAFSPAPNMGAQNQFGGIATAMPTAGAAGQFGNTMPQFAVFQQPIVQDMAMQYGQRLADQGKQIMENQFEKWVPVAKLKYYFAVDNNYVINKLRLLFFPFTHKEWAVKYDQDNPVQPRYDVNAPDLYIPTMAYITYVVVAGLMLGMQNSFSPEQLGIQASSALAYCIFEMVVYSITLYVVNIKTNLKTLDLLAFSGYKFVIIVACLLLSTVFHRTGYYSLLFYSSLSLGFFLLRTLKTKVLTDNARTATGGDINYDPYTNAQQLDYPGGRKRKLYFLFLIIGGQAFFSFLLSKHLYLPDAIKLNDKNMPL